MNLMMLLEMAVTGFGDRIAVKNASDALSYSQLMSATATVAQHLQEAGVEHLAMLDESSLALPLSLFGSARAGLPFVPLNYRLTGSELESLLAQIAPALLVTEADRVEEVGRLPGIQAVSKEAFIERARLGLPTEVRGRPAASADFAYKGVRERYGMVRSRESILPFDLVVKGSLTDLSFGAFPRIRQPRKTPDAFLYK